MRHSIIPLLFILCFYFLIAFYRLDTLPGEWFGDISNLHEYVLDIQQGKWPLSYRQSVGPLYHYAIIPFLPITGQRYIGYKELSVFSGALSLIALFLLAEALFDRSTAILTTGIGAVSFWFLVWARLGNLHAILPGLSAVTVWAAVRWKQTGKMRFIGIGAIVASLGVFAYLETMILPIIFILLVVLVPFDHFEIKKKAVLFSLIVFAVAGVMFGVVITRDTNEFFNPKGYIGGKIIGLASVGIPTLLIRTVAYGGETLGMLNIRGDHVFRVNVPDSPMLDPISGVLLIIGLIGLIRPMRRGKRLFIFIPLVFLTLPAIIPSLLPQEIPSATRTFAAIPFVFLLVGLGIQELGRLGRLGKLGIGGLIAVIVLFNIHKYFVEYPQTLPNHNVAYGTAIAKYIDTVPISTHVYLADYGWGESGQPDPKGIYYQLHNLKNRINLKYVEQSIECPSIVDSDIVVIVSPRQPEVGNRLQTCHQELSKRKFTDETGYIIFYAYSLHSIDKDQK